MYARTPKLLRAAQVRMVGRLIRRARRIPLGVILCTGGVHVRVTGHVWLDHDGGGYTSPHRTAQLHYVGTPVHKNDTGADVDWITDGVGLELVPPGAVQEVVAA